jgi:hypothetical protein
VRADTEPVISPDVLLPYRAVRDAMDRVAWWPERPGDPRRSLGWACGSRRAGDGLWFVGAPHGPALWSRWIAGDGILPRMNAVDVCGGLVAGVEADPALVAEARTACRRQVVAAANGYVSPLVAVGPVAEGEVAMLLAEVVRAAEGAGAVPSVLHCPPGDPLLEMLPDLGFVCGITDLYPVIDLPGSGVGDYLAALSRHRRTNVRREMRALEGGRGRVHVGWDAAPHLAGAGQLVSAAYGQRGQEMDPAAVTEIYTRLLTACGEDFVLCVVDIDGVPVASGCLITGETDILLYSAGMRQPETRAVAGYFNAAYYLPIEFGYARGARRLLLGPAAVPTKLLRGARVNPVISAVPSACVPLARLLAATDGHLRRQMESLRA